MSKTYRFEVEVTVEDPADMDRQIQRHNANVDAGRATGIISDEPTEWDWDQLVSVYDNEMAGENAFEITSGEEA